MELRRGVSPHRAMWWPCPTLNCRMRWVWTMSATPWAIMRRRWPT